MREWCVFLLACTAVGTALFRWKCPDGRFTMPRRIANFNVVPSANGLSLFSEGGLEDRGVFRDTVNRSFFFSDTGFFGTRQFGLTWDWNRPA